MTQLLTDRMVQHLNEGTLDGLGVVAYLQYNGECTAIPCTFKFVDDGAEGIRYDVVPNKPHGLNGFVDFPLEIKDGKELLVHYTFVEGTIPMRVDEDKNFKLIGRYERV